MALFCRICVGKFINLSSFDNEQDNVIVATICCGHLFHRKCLDASMTNKKLAHAKTGTGPFIRFCPAFQCVKQIPENGVIEICTTQHKSPSGEDMAEDSDNIEVKLTKKALILKAERDKIQQQFNILASENEGFKETMDEIKAECDEIATVLLDDKIMRKGDRVFWITTEKTLAPGRILEMRKMSSINSHNNCHFAIIKLDKKIKLPSLGTERETAIVPITEVLTFKSFFKDSFNEFRHKLWKILDEAKQKKTADGRQRLLRSKFRESGLRLSLDSQYGLLRESLSDSHETIEFVALEELATSKSASTISELQQIKRSTRLSRAKSMYFGMQRASSQDIQEKIRSTSWNNNNPSPYNKDASVGGSNFSSIIHSPTFSISPIADEENRENSEYITNGEYIIYYDQNSKSPQTGTVACVLKYTPCAIVKFDELPTKSEVFQYRTVPLADLFPYALASPDEKYKIAEVYGRLDDFIPESSDIFNAEHEGEYFSTSSTEELFITIHEV